MTALEQVARHERFVLGAAALCFAACLANPGVPANRALFDHVVVLDVTQSMNALDMQLDGRAAPRLAAAKQALRESMLALPCGSRLGLGLFTEYRSLLLLAPVEVCANLGELRATLARIDGRMAWIGNSEVAKGLHSALAIARELPEKPSLVFVTDGHEAPPLSPRHRPRFDDKPGEVPGLIVGVGGPQPVPIPKTDPLGRPLGTWGADEVLQTDPRSRGRGGSVAETMVEDEGPSPAPPPGATPGLEHLTSLREPYLRLLASELGLGFVRLDTPATLAAALTAPALARQVPARVDLRPALALLGLALILARCLAGLKRPRAPWSRA